jgi:hypothetical protein
MVMVDGLFFAIRGSLLLDGLRFDDKTFDGFDFYDADICFQVLSRGYKVACIDTMVCHKSIGEIINKDGWTKNKDKLINKWSWGTFPINSKSFLPKSTEIE